VYTFFERGGKGTLGKNDLARCRTRRNCKVVSKVRRVKRKGNINKENLGGEQQRFRKKNLCKSERRFGRKKCTA